MGFWTLYIYTLSIYTFKAAHVRWGCPARWAGSPRWEDFYQRVLGLLRMLKLNLERSKTCMRIKENSIPHCWAGPLARSYRKFSSHLEGYQQNQVRCEISPVCLSPYLHLLYRCVDIYIYICMYIYIHIYYHIYFIYTLFMYIQRHVFRPSEDSSVWHISVHKYIYT